MERTFFQFCTCGMSDYAFLLERVDTCANFGRSYEFPRCRMPEDCLPVECTVGFWRAPDGYLLYFRPAPVYQGNNSRLIHLFSRDRWHFATFNALIAALSNLCPAAAQENIGIPLLTRLRSSLQEFVFGQDDAVEATVFKLHSHICKRYPRRPLSLIFYGPTGVGKSELAKSVAPALDRCCPDRKHSLVWTELNTFTQPHSAYRLTGAPPGYVGYDDPPVLESVRAHPHSVFVFDELEKAHPEILKIFMSILDEGRCTARRADETGNRELDFRHCVFIFTTNLDLAENRHSIGFSQPTAPIPDQTSAAPDPLVQHIFSADESARQALARCGVLREIAGRFSGLIGFRELTEDARIAVTVGQIKALGREYGLSIAEVAPALARALVPNHAFSARSTTGILEGCLTPLFLSHASASLPERPLRLSGTPDALQLTFT